MRYCKACTEPDTRPGQIFNDEGLCTPCAFLKEQRDEDWAARHEELMGIVAWANARRSSLGYDAIIGVSGGKDSTRLAFYARQIGLNPLLVSFTYPPHQMSLIGAHNLGNLIEQGFDVHTINVSPDIYRHALRLSFLRFANWTNPSEIALYASIPRAALQYAIPLACAGENPFITVGSGSGSTDGDATNVVSLNTLGGGDLTPFIDDHNTPDRMILFRFPERERILRNDLRMIYLGYYMRDFDPEVNASFAKAHGMQVRTGADADPERTGSYHNHTALDEDFVFVNQFLKYIKLGFGMTTQQVSLDVRAGRLTRDEAVELVRRFDGKLDPVYITRFCKYLRISENQFWDTAERHRNPEIWTLTGSGWELSARLLKAAEMAETSEA